MSDLSLHEIGFGWIPNIDGKVSCSAHIKNCIVENPEINPYKIKSGEPKEGKPTLLVPIITRTGVINEYLYVRLDDDSGKCTLFIDESLYGLLYPDGKNEKTSNELLYLTWRSLRCTLDSSSMPMDRTERKLYKILHDKVSKQIRKKITRRRIACCCSAMNTFVITLDKTNLDYYDEILNLFESVNENTSDALIALSSRKFANRRATLEYNQLYAESFMNLYSGMDPATIQEKILEFRHRKAEIISKHIESEHSWWDTGIFILSLLVAGAALFISIWNISP